MADSVPSLGISSASDALTARSTSVASPTAPDHFHPIRRAATALAGSRDDSPQSSRRRSMLGNGGVTGGAGAGGGMPQQQHQYASPETPDTPLFESLRRRSSTFSEYNLNEARRILNPGGHAAAASLQPRHGDRGGSGASSGWSSVPLAFALLPALGGVLFQDGSAVITDVMLLGLAAVFLHWSVTQPWLWYHAAQEVRIREETFAEMDDTVIEDDSDVDHSPARTKQSKLPEKIPEKEKEEEEEEEEEEGASPSPSPPDGEVNGSRVNGSGASHPGRRSGRDGSMRDRSQRARRAVTELYVHEMMALLSCFACPLLGAYLLHAIRSQLSRPSEGLVSNYNLTIFLLAAEIHPLSHLIKLVQARTLHLQKVVHANPYQLEGAPSAAQMLDMARRLDELELRDATQGELAPAAPTAVQQLSGSGAGSDPVRRQQQQAKQEAAMVREVRNAIQPELDALNRAVRRYEKKATVLALQTEARLGTLDARLGDAVALAAAAAKNSGGGGGSSLLSWLWSPVSRLADGLMWVALLPVQAVVGAVTLPFRTMSTLFWRGSSKSYGSGGGGNIRRRGGSDGSGGSDRGGQRDRRGIAGSGTAKGSAFPSSMTASSGPVRLGTFDRVPSRLSKR